MSSLTLMGEITSASAFLGVLSLIGYWLTKQQFKQKESSIRAIVQGDGIFDTDRVVGILGEFRGEAEKLEALRLLANHDLQKAESLLRKVNARVDLTRFNAHAMRARLQALLISAAVCVVIIIVGAIYSLAPPQHENGGSTARIDPPPSPIVINNILPSQIVESVQKVQPPPALAPAPPSSPQEAATTPASTPPPVRPAVRKPQGLSTRCQNLFLRSSLGDKLSSDEQTELRSCM